MQAPLQVSFKNMDHSDAVEARIRGRFEKLHRHFDRIVSCQVTVDAGQRRHRSGNLFEVRINLSVPGDELVVNHAKPHHPAHKDVYVAVRDAFDAAVRQLEDHSRVRRGEVKTHATE